MKKALLIAALVALAGCASRTIGTKFDSSKVDDLKPGAAYEEVVTTLGKPSSVEYAADGRRAVSWSYIEADVGGAKKERVVILFDKEGKMTRVAQRQFK